MEYPHWWSASGTCPACVQQELLYTRLNESDAALHARIQQVWPLDAEAAFGALSTPLRLHADPRFTGAGATVAFVDSGFFPHPDLTRPANRIRAWVNASIDPPQVIGYEPDEFPKWPNWDKAYDRQWHGTMTSVAAAGNGYLSHGLYRGLASSAELVLIQAYPETGRADDDGIVRALQWIKDHRFETGISVVSISLGGERTMPLRGNPIDSLIADLVAAGVVVVVAAGNDGARSLTPPATAPHALTVGGIDDHNTFDHEDIALWHSNYGSGVFEVPKPELVAPSIWVAAPVLPKTAVAHQAEALFNRRGDLEAEQHISELKLITPHYQHVDGTSFAAPLVASTVACMLEANPGLSPATVREILAETATIIPGAPRERQGAGALEAGLAVAGALHHGQHQAFAELPLISANTITFRFHDHAARTVELRGSWDNWQTAHTLAPGDGSWQLELPLLPNSTYKYKYIIDQHRWLDDPANPLKRPDNHGGFNSLLIIDQ